jgi:hypothetical protein
MYLVGGLRNVCVCAVVRFRSCFLSRETKRGTKIKTLSYTSPHHCANILLCVRPFVKSFLSGCSACRLAGFFVFLNWVKRWQKNKCACKCAGSSMS